MSIGKSNSLKICDDPGLKSESVVEGIKLLESQTKHFDEVDHLNRFHHQIRTRYESYR